MQKAVILQRKGLSGGFGMTVGSAVGFHKPELLAMHSSQRSRMNCIRINVQCGLN